MRVNARERAPVIVHSLGFHVKARHPRTAPVTMDGLLTKIPEPHIRVWLDEPAQMADGPVPVTYPTTISSGESKLFS